MMTMLEPTAALSPEPEADRGDDLLPSEASAFFRKVTAVVTQLAARARTFTYDDISTRLPNRATLQSPSRARSVPIAVGKLMRQGALRRLDSAVALKEAVFELAAEPVLPEEPAFFATTTVHLTIPRTLDGLWSLMRWLDVHRHGFFQHDLSRYVAGEIDNAEINAYLAALERGRLLTRTNIAGAAFYRVDRRQITTPRVRSDGSLTSGSRRQEYMWRTMKMSGFFTAFDIASAASQPDLPISIGQAARYADDLAAAGYLSFRDRTDGGRVYRLKRAMNTGPAPPEVLRARFVFDANLCRVMGSVVAIEEVRP